MKREKLTTLETARLSLADACMMLNLSRPLAKESPIQRLLPPRTWARFLSPISFYTIALGDNAPLDIGALLTPYSDIGLWTSPFFLYTEAILVDQTRSF